MIKLALALVAAIALMASGYADAQGRPGGGGRGGGGGGGGGGMPSMGGGGGGGYGGVRGVNSGGSRGSYAGSGYRGGYGGSAYRGGYGGAGYRGGYWGGRPGYGPGYRPGYRPGYGGGYWGGYWGPSLGFYIGGPAYWGAWGFPYYAPGAYAVTTPVVIEQEATYYTQAPAQAGAATTSYWYYCTDPAGYYPYVQSCSKGWIPVVPQPVPPPAG